jgi:predicted Zn-dependent peptidase
MIYKKEINDTYNLHTIKTDKFKLCHIEIIFRNNVDVNEITKRNVLFDLLSECSNKYPTKRLLSLKLEDLYSASLYNVTSRVGNAVITNFCMEFISPKYINEDITEDALSLLFDLIFNPYVSNNEFNSKLFDYIKERNQNNIKSIKENPKKYATLEALKSLGPNTPSSYSSIGNLNDLDNITPQNLYDYYEQVLKNDFIDIYVIGDLDMNKVSKIINKNIKLNVIKNHEFKMYYQNIKRKCEIVNDYYKYAQSNIVVILNLSNLSPYEKKYLANIYNVILGGGSLESKLFTKLRKENSLCYNVSSMYQKYDSLIIINTAVDINSSKKALKLIKEAINEMKSNISNEELEKAKKLIITSLNMGKDNIGKIVDNYFYQDVSDLDTYDKRIQTFNDIKIPDIYKLTKKISISTEYILNGGENNANN